jgi:hypothetical protein
VRACVRVCVCVCACVPYVRVRVSACVCMRACVLGTRGLAAFIARPARALACRSIRARWAAGATWRCRTASAPWAGRAFHTSVVDAAGAIYVIGGESGGTYYNDVWKSTDGGADPDSRRGWSGGTRWILQGDLGVRGGEAGLLARGTGSLLVGYSGGTQGYFGRSRLNTTRHYLPAL